MGDVVDFFLFVILMPLIARFVQWRVGSSKAPKYLSKKWLKQAVIGSTSQWLAQLGPSHARRAQAIETKFEAPARKPHRRPPRSGGQA